MIKAMEMDFFIYIAVMIIMIVTAIFFFDAVNQIEIKIINIIINYFNIYR